LKKLPIHTLKIDKSFIHNLDMEEEIIVNTIINMNKNAVLKVKSSCSILNPRVVTRGKVISLVSLQMLMRLEK